MECHKGNKLRDRWQCGLGLAFGDRDFRSDDHKRGGIPLRVTVAADDNLCSTGPLSRAV